MAGSYQHILDGWSLIENMGDAYEAAEELMYLIQSDIGEARAKRLLERYWEMKRGEIEPDKYFYQVQRMMGE